ncbi:divergent polysaccharide deacetylase family protein [Alkalicaulis satelles]|uniref:Divergent polysaccharide deacetylase family protein n=1 Tax=Alkalicaulis satelles TaxID=2609175 RepID=A0A5M6ZKS2_9PROT|nr:divergent polysaccharide deacetylase family protein [Alkalicaulis satelles]KAA5804565.1 divergent polysaccharide deacetylase family protein [Alkalicaulis satelles]
MIRCAAYAPHLGAALGAALMAGALVAFSAGERAPLAEKTAPQAGIVLAEQHLDGPALPGPHTAPHVTAAPQITPSPLPAPDAADPAAAPTGPMLAVIIDDVGLDRAAAERLMEMPVTLAILPYAAGAPELAQAANSAGREVFVHLPMEPGGVDDPGPFALSRSQDARAIAARVRWAFTRVPGASGFNNHMGSGFTADRAAMDAVFAALAGQEGQLVFVDSLTGPRSVAARAGSDAGFAALRRDVFLDVERSDAAISARLDEALEMALARGHAVTIGHPYPETLSVLERLEERAAARGVRLVSVSTLAGALEARPPS